MVKEFLVEWLKHEVPCPEATADAFIEYDVYVEMRVTTLAKILDKLQEVNQQHRGATAAAGGSEI